MAHIVKCAVCGEKFDRDKVQAVKYGARRYAHHRCLPEGEKVPLVNPVNEDLVKLEEYIANLLGDSYNPARTKKQIKDYQSQYGYSYSGMLKTLIWFYEIKGNPIAKAQGGIGIIPFVYNDALQYYYSLYLAQLANESLSVQSYERKIKEIEIVSPEVHRKPIKMFNAGGDD